MSDFKILSLIRNELKSLNVSNTALNDVIKVSNVYQTAIRIVEESFDGFTIGKQLYNASSVGASNRINHVTPVVTLASDDYHLNKLSPAGCQFGDTGNTNAVQVSLVSTAGVARQIQYSGDNVNTTADCLAVHICNDNPIMTDIKTSLASIDTKLDDLVSIEANIQSLLDIFNDVWDSTAHTLKTSVIP